MTSPLISLTSGPLSSRPHWPPFCSSGIGVVPAHGTFMCLCVATLPCGNHKTKSSSLFGLCPGVIFSVVLCNLTSYFKFQFPSLPSPDIPSSPGGHSPAEGVTGCHQLGTAIGRAASLAFTPGSSSACSWRASCVAQYCRQNLRKGPACGSTMGLSPACSGA